MDSIEDIRYEMKSFLNVLNSNKKIDYSVYIQLLDLSNDLIFKSYQLGIRDYIESFIPESNGVE